MPDYDVLGDIANASKHAQLTRGAPKFTHAQSLSELVVFTEFSDDQGKFTHARKLEIVKLDDATKREVFDIATNVINFGASNLPSGECSTATSPSQARLRLEVRCCHVARRVDLT